MGDEVLVHTASQTVGPFLHIALADPQARDAVEPGSPGAIVVRGTVTDGAGDPLPDALVETWQVDGLFGPLTAAGRRLGLDGGGDRDYPPQPAGSTMEPAVDVEPDAGPVMVTVEYTIDPGRAAEFTQVMQRTRRARLRQGALSWGLFRDAAHPDRFIEYFVDENWIEHQRRLARFSAFDAELRDRRFAFHLGDGPPRVTRYIGQSFDTATEQTR